MGVVPGSFTKCVARNLLASITTAALVCGTAAAQVATHEFGLTEEQMVTTVETVEAHIAECMREAGFEYVPVNYKTVQRGMDADKSLPGYSESEYIDAFGYGITTLYTGEGPLASDVPTPAQIGLGEKNMEIYRNLGAADKAAYDHALLGEHLDITFAVGFEIENFAATGGCTRKAVEQVFTPEELSTTYKSPKDRTVDSDPRKIESLAKYAECMHDAGFNYAHEKEIEPELRQRLHEITGGLPVSELSEQALAGLADLQAYERSLGRVTVECEEEYLDPVTEAIENEMFGRQ